MVILNPFDKNNVHETQAAPVSVLSGEGLFSCLCLALHQAHVVVTGTAEGCLLLWDLREPASLSRSVVGRNSRGRVRVGVQIRLNIVFHDL